jgi:hypothetical protein
VVDAPAPPTPAPPDWKMPAEASLLSPSASTEGESGLPVVMVKRAALAPVLEALQAKKPASAVLDVGVAFTRSEAFNVVGRLRTGKPPAGLIVLGAHYDHLGQGGRHSLAPDRHEPHLGADDNASGASTLLELARDLAHRRAELNHDVVVAFFSGEEEGLLGSAHYTRVAGDVVKDATAMLNFDMVGRLRANRIELLGGDSATEWASLTTAACSDLRLDCKLGRDGHGPSDQASFYAAGVPVLHFFTGSHSDYHKPSDVAAKINAAGAAQIARLAERLVVAIDAGPRLTYQKGKSAAAAGDARSFNASLGTIPDYSYGGPPAGPPGVLLADVRVGGAAEKGGLRRGDVLVKLGEHAIRGVEDLMYALNASRPGQTVTAVVVRSGAETKIEVTFQEGRH